IYHRHTHQQDAAQVHQHEGAAAVLARDIGEFPDIAEPHRRARGGEDEGPAARPGAVQTPVSVAHDQYQGFWPIVLRNSNATKLPAPVGTTASRPYNPRHVDQIEKTAFR